jgi:hypothetical protein
VPDSTWRLKRKWWGNLLIITRGQHGSNMIDYLIRTCRTMMSGMLLWLWCARNFIQVISTRSHFRQWQQYQEYCKAIVKIISSCAYKNPMTNYVIDLCFEWLRQREVCVMACSAIFQSKNIFVVCHNWYHQSMEITLWM